jgi:hypothetical protein
MNGLPFPSPFHYFAKKIVNPQGISTQVSTVTANPSFSISPSPSLLFLLFTHVEQLHYLSPKQQLF